MAKHILFSLLILTFVGCGKKSEIKNAVKAEKLPETYKLVIPLSDQEITRFDTPTPSIGFLADGLASILMTLGTKIGMGKAELNLTQAVPELPVEYLESLKIKRVFFYIEPTDGARFPSLSDKVFHGKANVDFNFVDKLGVVLESEKIEKPDITKPFTEIKTLIKESKIYQNLFEVQNTKSFSLPPHDEVVLIKYEKEGKNQFIRNNKFGKIFIINSKRPAKTRFYLQDHPKLQGYFKRIHTLHTSVLVELEKDPDIEDNFMQIIHESKNDLNKLGAVEPEECTSEICLDLKVSDNNLLPIILKENAIKLNTFIEAGKVPPSFQLKGFVEFEIKINSPI